MKTPSLELKQIILFLKSCYYRTVILTLWFFNGVKQTIWQPFIMCPMLITLINYKQASCIHVFVFMLFSSWLD